MYKYKNFNQKIIICISLFISIVLCINYFINPFNIFKQRLLPETLVKADAKVQERVTKPIGFKIDKRKINAIFLGSSRVDLCIDKNDYKSLTGKEAENLAIGAVLPHEIIELTELARKIHPEIKEIFIGLDFESLHVMSSINDNRAAITKNKKLEISELSTALLSVKAIGTSFWTIFKNTVSSYQRTYYSSGVKRIFVNKDIVQEFKNTMNEYNIKYSAFRLDENELINLLSYLKLLQSKGIKIKIFVMPTHITLQKLRYDYNLTEKYNYIQELVLKDFDIYDFNYPNQYTKEKISPDMQYFFDGSHATHNLSKLIITDLLSEKPTLARKITKYNVNRMNNLLEKELKNCGDCDVI